MYATQQVQQEEDQARPCECLPKEKQNAGRQGHQELCREVQDEKHPVRCLHRVCQEEVLRRCRDQLGDEPDSARTKAVHAKTVKKHPGGTTANTRPYPLDSEIPMI